MTRQELIKALRLFHYDPAWRRIKKGKRASHLVPMRALAKQSGVSYIQIYRAVLHGHISDRAASKLKPFVEKVLDGRGKFVFVCRKGYEFRDDALERIGGCP